MPSLVDSKTAVVTGGASGIGRAIANALAEHGADVVVADVREAPRTGGRPTHELIEADYGVNARYVECDVTEPEELNFALDVAEELGTPRIVEPVAPTTGTSSVRSVRFDPFMRCPPG